MRHPPAPQSTISGSDGSSPRAITGRMLKPAEARVSLCVSQLAPPSEVRRSSSSCVQRGEDDHRGAVLAGRDVHRPRAPGGLRGRRHAVELVEAQRQVVQRAEHAPVDADAPGEHVRADHHGLRVANVRPRAAGDRSCFRRRGTARAAGYQHEDERRQGGPARERHRCSSVWRGGRLDLTWSGSSTRALRNRPPRWWRAAPQGTPGRGGNRPDSFD
jgi:hypothetical protein